MYGGVCTRGVTHNNISIFTDSGFFIDWGGGDIIIIIKNLVGANYMLYFLNRQGITCSWRRLAKVSMLLSD